ncbi:MAG: hypothetical protein LKE41_11170 [Prevotella sp.]|nr:hypothetical protein [Prevotella sp.]MCI2080650.1 hypothetical protein [Prevotella sp.]MCI2102580.1 hypothetical protein [Prevotella sp.]
MRRMIVLFSVLLPVSMGIRAQSDKAVVLKEVKVEATRVVKKVDGQLIIPSETQKKASTNGYNLLRMLSLPGLRVDEVNRSVLSLTNRGNVQIRINGVIATKEDLLSLDPTSIRNISFIDSPGVRYGADIAYVIDIRTHQGDRGYTAGLESSNMLTGWTGDESVYHKMNWDHSELGLTYDFSYRDFKGNLYKEKADYLLADGTHYVMTRDDEASRKRYFNHQVELKYNLADSTSYAFQLKVSTAFNHTPNEDENRRIRDHFDEAITLQRHHDKNFSPVLDLYFYHTLGKHQSLTTNLVGTHIRTDAYDYQNEGAAYEYTVKGRTSSLVGEMVYENRLMPVIFSLGTLFSWKYTCNDYSGAVESLNGMHNSSVYVFGEIKGSLWKRLGYKAGIGASNQRYRQDENRFNFWLFRPKVTLTLQPFTPLQMRYVFEVNQHVSKIAMISNTRIRENSMEWKMGNPDIKPNREITHDWIIDYTLPRLTIHTVGEFRDSRHPNMERWTRTADNQFYYSQSNQKAIKMLYGETYVNYEIIPDVWKASVNGGIFRFINIGDDYRHEFTSYLFGANMQVYLGRWTLVANTDNGWRWMEGERKNRNGSNLDLSVSWHVGNCDLSLVWIKPFSKRPALYHSYLLDSYLTKDMSVTSRAAGNALVFNFSWQLQRGKKYKAIQKRLENKDTETGIL